MLSPKFAAMTFPFSFNEWLQVLFIAFCAVFAIQLFYFIFFYSRTAFHKSKGKEDAAALPPVTVIVCARDEAPNLVNNLPGILVQNSIIMPEVIVVNDNSYDESKYILSELQNDWKQLKVIELTQEAKMIPGKKFPLSIGIKSAANDIVLLTDADCVPASENWINSMAACYDDQTEIVLGYGAYHKKKGLLNKFIRWETFNTALQYLSYAMAGIPYMGVGRNLSYKKDLFFRLKGFSSHNHIMGGDDDLFVNMAASSKNTRVNLSRESFTLSKPAASFAEWIRQKTRHYSTSRRYKPPHKFLLGLYSLSQFLFYPLGVFAFMYNWQLAAIMIGSRLLIVGAVYFFSMKKLDEKDLFPLFPVFDLLMPLYYVFFTPALLRKNKIAWK
jgi:cellulose synthase/poly-beta-1,6-N-acetylglucosamine synthase-like glycosyltransferase